MKIKKQRGFSILELVLALGVIAIFLGLVLGNVLLNVSQTKSLLTMATRDRIWTGFRQVATMPAAVRNSARMVIGTLGVNPDLYKCVYGATANGCQNGVESAMTLYSPYYPMDATGNLLPSAMQVVSMPCSPLVSGGCSVDTAVTQVRFDEFGNPCKSGELNCIFMVFTSFIPSCGALTLPPVPPADLLSPTNLLAATPTCTVAEFIRVRFLVEVDKDAKLSDYQSTANTTSKLGEVTVNVKEVSGNDPQ